MAIMIKLSEKYTANSTKRIGVFTVSRKWQFVKEDIAKIAEKFDPKGNIYEIKKAVSDKAKSEIVKTDSTGEGKDKPVTKKKK